MSEKNISSASLLHFFVLQHSLIKKIWLSIFWAILAFFQKVAGPLLQRSLIQVLKKSFDKKCQQLPGSNYGLDRLTEAVTFIQKTWGGGIMWSLKENGFNL